MTTAIRDRGVLGDETKNDRDRPANARRLRRPRPTYSDRHGCRDTAAHEGRCITSGYVFGMGCNRGDGGSPVPPHSVTPTGAVVRFKVLAAWFGAMTNCWGSTSLAVWTCLYRMHGAGNAGAGHQTDGETEWALSLSHPVQRMYKSGYLSYDKRWCDQVS
jgi:hypothetical protein